MAYADYGFYIGEYAGNSVGMDGFSLLAARASAFLDYYTQGRARHNAELYELKMACCALAELYQVIEQAQAVVKKASCVDSAGELQSQSVGGWTKTYRSGWDGAKQAAEEAAKARASLAETARRYLSGTGLIYRGGRRGCVSPHCDGL